MKSPERIRGSVVLALGLLFAACGSVSPLSTSPLATDGGAAGATGSAGTKGGAGTTGAAGVGGTTGSAGTGAAGTTGVAGAGGTTGGAGVGGTTGTAGTGGRVPLKHRAAAMTCSTQRPSGTCETSTTVDAGTFSCRKDSECTGGLDGRCLPSPRVLGCQCSYDTCTTDADCAKAGMGGPCECRPAAQNVAGPANSASNVCKQGNCRTDADCGAGGYCSPSLGPCGLYSGVVGYYCHTKHDACVDDGDCTKNGAGDCRFDQAAGAWACATSQCAG
jgi:hypothetical protein